MLSVYFDTNVYDWIDKGRSPSLELEALRLAFNDGRLVGHLGIPVIEELVGQWQTDRMAVVRKLVLVRDLIGFTKILKPANTLLEEAIRAYATGAPSPSEFLSEDQHDRAVDLFRGIFAGDAGVDAMISKIVCAGESLKQTALDQWIRSRAEVHTGFDPKLVEAGHPQRKNIRWWLKSEELAYVEGLIRPLGIDLEIQRRELQGLLELKPVRAYVNALAAYVFAITVGKERQPRAPRWGDGYDMWQIISASTADTFVTYDDRLVDLLNRLPVNGFRIFPSIAALNDAITR
jgi:hypothetical protein